ncbi:HEAT repeat domain-containing protein [Marisediminicola senii]|uniref:HEAT repeat domain-containing protein n=1 Tax=Marisediminicola senii TaxID=2711233 RepID=UPI0013E9A595|nr:HEAT repeat domain-containing protein [Marisediminicola senii]
MPNQPNPRSVPLDLPTDERLHLAVQHYGNDEVVERAVALMAGANAGDDFLLYAGGRHAQGVLDGAPPLYWPEAWGARVLLHVWNQSAAPAVIEGLENQAWRVREACAKVCVVREIHVAQKLLAMLTDEVPRVRAAALRALAEVGTAEHIDAVGALVKDPEKEVRRAAQQSRDALIARTGGAAGGQATGGGAAAGEAAAGTAGPDATADTSPDSQGA